MEELKVLKCDGGCAVHIGDVVPVLVYEPPMEQNPIWSFNYCEEAISEDKRRGLTVVINEAEVNNS